MKTLQLAAQLNKASRRADDSVAITFITAEEIGTDLFTQIDEYRKVNGFVLFKANEITLDEIPVEQAAIKGQVSPSKYLRSRLFAKHMAEGGKKEDFPQRYEKYIYGLAQEIDDSYEH